MINHLLQLKPEVALALQEGRPVVALESTIIAHGMPFPQNVQTALQLEKTIRQVGVVPATVAVMDGKLRVGLEKAEITTLGQLGEEVIKTSRRDLPMVLASGQYGATTVAATVIAARMAGISVFATGGIGGVHRGAPRSMDISADLQELAHSRVAVVCAGVKAILDIGLTLEYLETQGVPVLGYRTKDFPAFYTRRSGYPVDFTVASVMELARVLKIKWRLGLKGGVVIANPIPERYQMDHLGIDQAIQQAQEEADAKGIRGKAVTPYLLARIEKLTKGASLEANRQLVLNNAKLAAQVAKGFAQVGANE